MSKSGMLAAVALAAGLGTEQASGFVLNAETLETHFPDLAATVKAAGFEAGKAEGAKLEHARILGIEAAAMPGHEAIIAAHKADAAKSPADAAMAVIAAEKNAAATRRAGLEVDEAKLAGLRSTGGEMSAATAAENPAAAAHDLHSKATGYIAEQAAKGITVSPIEAVNHVSKKG